MKKLSTPVDSIIAALIIAIAIITYVFVNQKNQEDIVLQTEPAKEKVKEVKDVFLVCEGYYKYTIIFNDKTRKLKIEGEDIDNIVKWNDNQIVYSHDDDDHRHTLDRISGVHGGVECRTSYGAVF